MRTYLNYFLILFQVVINTAAQLLLKNGAKSLDFSQGPLSIFTSMLGNLYIWSGGLIFVISFLLWIYLLNQFELSFLYPFGSLAFVLAAFGGWIFFGENITLYRLFGIFSIFIGVLFVAKS